MSLDKIQIVFQSREPSSQRAGTLTDRATEAPIVSFPQKKKKKKKKREKKGKKSLENAEIINSTKARYREEGAASICSRYDVKCSVIGPITRRWKPACLLVVEEWKVKEEEVSVSVYAGEISS